MYAKYFKRILDFSVALGMMPFVILLGLIIGPLIKLEDKGPVTYRQTRRGLRGRTFDILKFRTMKVNSPDLRASDGSTWSASNDPRVTRIGRFLRQTSLDEVPQIVNILKGDMSFIGPRPTLATEDYRTYSAVKKKRLEVRPGLTGYAQAYFRNSISAEEKFRYDSEYVDKISFLMDVKIFLQTIFSVLARKDINPEDKTIETHSRKKPLS